MGARWAGSFLFVWACQGDLQSADLGVPVTVQSAGAVTCAAPGDRRALGPYERRQSPTPRPSDPWTWHGGILAADLDEDGHMDLLSALEVGVEVYQGLGDGKLEPRGRELLEGIDLSYASGASAADYDADGDLDVYITRVVGAPAPAGEAYGVNRLLRNDGGWKLVDVTQEAGVSACGLDPRDGRERCFRSMASSWGDYDGDGDLDLYVGNYGFVDETNGTTQDQQAPAERDFLYRNEGDGRFFDASQDLPREFHVGYTYAGGFHDLDSDGALDLYAVNDFGVRYPNRVLWGDGRGGFSFVGGPPLSDGSRLDASQTGMGLGIGDLNGDGQLDLAIAEWRKNTLFISRPELGGWVDHAQSSGFVGDESRQQQVGWGTIMGDVDNDGWLDILNQYGHLESENTDRWPNFRQQPDALYLNLGAEEPAFTDVGEAWGVADEGMSRGAVLADINGDGWLDLAKRSLDEDDALYLSRCGEEGWLVVRLSQPGTANTWAVGARVHVRAGDRSQMQPIVAGGVGYGSSPPLLAHFGLGEADRVDEIRVVWPDGQESRLLGVAARQQITLVREAR